jgi:hypothetical protein
MIRRTYDNYVLRGGKHQRKYPEGERGAYIFIVLTEVGDFYVNLLVTVMNSELHRKIK